MNLTLNRSLIGHQLHFWLKLAIILWWITVKALTITKRLSKAGTAKPGTAYLETCCLRPATASPKCHSTLSLQIKQSLYSTMATHQKRGTKDRPISGGTENPQAGTKYFKKGEASVLKVASSAQQTTLIRKERFPPPKIESEKEQFSKSLTLWQSDRKERCLFRRVWKILWKSPNNRIKNTSKSIFCSNKYKINVWEDQVWSNRSSTPLSSWEWWKGNKKKIKRS